MFAEEGNIGPAWRLLRIPFGLDTRFIDTSRMESPRVRIVRSANDVRIDALKKIKVLDSRSLMSQSPDLMDVVDQIQQGFMVGSVSREVARQEVKVAMPPSTVTFEDPHNY